MGFAVLALLFAIITAPKHKGRLLEDVDELFAKFRWRWEYKSYQTIGVGAAVARAEAGEVDHAVKARDEDHGNEDDKNEEQTVSVNLV